MFEFSFSKKNILLVSILSVIFSVLLEIYVAIVENSNLLFEIEGWDYLNIVLSVFSFKQWLIFLILFLIVFCILVNPKIRNTLLEFVYKYRLLLAGLVFVLSIIFEIHGSSIGVITYGGEAHNSLLGQVRWTKVDEYCINTMFAFSQYYNGFGLLNDIIRAAATNMFIIGELPVLDIATIFKPFDIGYLFLSQGQGLAFCWMGRLISLFVVSFEFGLLLAKRNRILALAYTVLVTFSPVVQWWFGVNGLVEMLVFGQLSILIIDKYRTVTNYYKRLLCALALVFSFGCFTFALYPAWEVPLGYVFLAVAIWVIYKKFPTFKRSKKDIALFALIIGLYVAAVAYVIIRCQDDLSILSNTVYPGLRSFNGGPSSYWLSGDPYVYFDYMRNIFEPLKPTQLTSRLSMSYFIAFFPLSWVLFIIVQFVQKRKDLLLYLLCIVYIFLLSFYLFTFPEAYAKLTLLSKTQSSRLFAIITFIDLLILIRSLSLLKKIDYSKISSKLHINENKEYSKLSFIISFILVLVMLAVAAFYFGGRFYSIPVVLIALVIFTIAFFFILNGSSRKSKIGFLCCVLIISFSAGGLVNPVESGTDYFFDNPSLQEVQKIVQNDPEAIWIVDGDVVQQSALTSVGARTLNSINPYTNFDFWETINHNNKSSDIYNRYALVKINIVNNAPTDFTCGNEADSINTSDQIDVTLNINDLKALNVTYITSLNDLSLLSNQDITFNKVYDNNVVKIFRVTYNS